MNNPLPVFHFLVEWGGARVCFTEISSLTDEVAVIEYREGSSPRLAPVVIPGVKRAANVTLKRGMLTRDNEMFAWFDSIGMGTVERRDVTISLLDSGHSPTMTWMIMNTWPSKICSSNLNANANEVAIESLELVCEGITRQAP